MGTTRQEIAIIYDYSSHWIGGVYYMQNLISAMNLLNDKEKPIVNVYSLEEKDVDNLRNITGYPYLVYQKRQQPSFIENKINRLHYMLAPKCGKYIKAIHQEGLKGKFIFPIQYLPHADKDITLAWIPDFQELYYPQYFFKRELRERDKGHRIFFSSHIPLVLSSYAAKKDCLKFYPEYEHNIAVLHFAVKHPAFSDVDMEQLKAKFHIKGQYIFCANQFWKHKNHLFLFNAYKRLRDKGFPYQLICSGQLKSYKDDEYTNSIREFLAKNHLEDDIKILGFIDRKEQLCLMKNSYAMVQPSLFEGWSTVVEDAKALNKFIFLSDLDVHKEQNPKNACFFDAKNEDDLVKKLLTVKPTQESYDYSENRKQFAKDFLEIINKYPNY